MGGTLAQLNLPAAVSSASYDASNRLTAWAGTSLTYDSNGNLLANGGSSYTWDARNRLVATSDAGGSFGYDAFGRRVSRLISGNTMSYVYDGARAAAENQDLLLAGSGLDQVLARATPTGVLSYLADPQGNTLGIVDGTGSLKQTYSYAPYGASVGSGSNDTSLQFTGRENDEASGLYYYRARYYSPQLGRFISQDPIGLAGGPNLYAYANGNPISNIDSLGFLSVVATIGGSLTPGLGAEGWGGIYITLPSPSNGWTPDVGVVGSGGIGPGWNIGVGVQAGLVAGGENELNGITANVNANGTVVGGTAMFDQNGLVGGMIGPTAEVGASAVVSQSKAAGLNDVGAWLGGAIFDLVQVWKFLHPPTGCQH